MKKYFKKFTPLNQLDFQNKIMFSKKTKNYHKTKLESYLNRAIFCTVFISWFLMWGNAMAVTYYSDFSTGVDSNSGTSTESPWKYAPGMSGWSGSVTLSSGDVVVLKGGETWTFTSTTANLWTIPVSGVTIQGGQRLETPWGTDYPVLDGAGSTLDRSGIYMTGKSNVLIDGIKVYKTELGNATTGGGSGIRFDGIVSGLEIKNCYIDATGDQGLRSGPLSTQTIKIHHNIVANVARPIFLAVDDGTVVDDVQIYNNSLIGGIRYGTDVHGDGFMIGSACTSGNTCLTNLKIHHNIFSGNWTDGATALIFLNNGTGSGSSQYGGNHVEIYNNRLTVDSHGIISPAFIYIWSQWNDVKIYNNTFGSYFYGTDDENVSACVNVNVSHFSTNVEIKNNIFSGCTNSGIIAKSTSITAIDYNVYSPEIVRMINSWTGSADCRTIASCHSSFDQEEHGLVADPKFTTLPNGNNSGDWSLQSDSPAINAGTDLSEYFTTDILGNPRSGVWDIGAYEYVGVSDTVAPASPTGLEVS